MATAPPPPLYNPQSVAKYRDYSLDGPESEAARKKGLASAQWYVPHIERKTLRRLMQRDDYHALRDTALWIIILASSGLASCRLWSQERYGAFVLTFLVYCTFYTSAADSRWHECGHATAFKTKWMNDVVYECASFMVFREALLWRGGFAPAEAIEGGFGLALIMGHPRRPGAGEPRPAVEQRRARGVFRGRTNS